LEKEARKLAKVHWSWPTEPKTGTLYTLKILIGKLDLVAITKEGNSADMWHIGLGHMSEKS